MKKILYGSVASIIGACGAYAALAGNTQVQANNNEKRSIDIKLMADAPSSYTVVPYKPITKTAMAAPKVEDKFAINKAVAGKFSIKGDVGYLYNFGRSWMGDFAEVGGNQHVRGAGNSAVGYGASLGYTHQSGFGISADYLAFNSKWNAGGAAYDAAYHALTLTPNYRFALDASKQWGLRVGLGLGFSLSDLSWGVAPGAGRGVVRGGSARSAFADESARSAFADESARSAFADESASEQNQGGTSAGGAVYSRVGGLKPFVASICGNVPSVKIYDRYGVGGVKSQCVAADGKKTADVVDEQISVWLAADPQARLGEPTLPKGGAAISYTVWSPILRAADRDHHALTVLRSSTDNPSLTAEQFQSALVRITTGYDGQSAPFAYQPYYDLPDAQGGIPYIPTKTPREMGISLTEAKRLLAGGTLFRHAGFGPPPPPPPPKDEVVEVVKEVRVKVPRFLPPEEIEKKVVKVVKVPQYLPPVEEVKEVVVEKRVKVPKYLPPVDEVEEVVVEKRVKVPKYLPPEQIEKEVVKEVKVKVPALLPPEEKEKEVVKEVAVPVDRGGRAAAEPSFVLVPQVALEYDNGLFHGDLNVRYLHAVQNVRYQGLAEQAGKTYSVNNSAVGLFVGAGFGVNF